MFGLEPSTPEIALYVDLLEGFNAIMAHLWPTLIAIKWIRRLFYSI